MFSCHFPSSTVRTDWRLNLANESLWYEAAELVCSASIDANRNHGFLTNKLKIGTPITPIQGDVHANFGFSTPFSFRVRSPSGTDRQTRAVL